MAQRCYGHLCAVANSNHGNRLNSKLQEVVMTPNKKGVADDQLGRYFRKVTAIAERLGKSLDPNLVLWVLQQVHDGEQFLSRRNDAPALSLASTFDMPAIERFVPKEKFTKVANPPPSQEFRIGSGKVWLHCSTSYDLFENVFLYGKNGKLERNLPSTTLRIHNFNDHGPFSWNYHDPAILAELGERHAIKLAHIWHLLELETDGKPTPLLTNGKKNQFYVVGRDGLLYGFHLTKVGTDKQDYKPFWSMWVYTIAQLGNYCYNEDQVISR